MKLHHFFFILVSFLFLYSCSPNPEEMLPHLNGYWEIEKVTFEDGTTKEFTINNQVDYIYIEQDTGIRKKVVPALDGSFKSTEDAETLTVSIVDDSLHLYYKTPYDSWRETVLKADGEHLVVRNKDGKTYNYKRFYQISID